MDEDFMAQTVKDMSIEELKKAIEFKVEQGDIFYGGAFNCKVAPGGGIDMLDAHLGERLQNIYDSLPALYKAVELSKKRRGK